MNLIEQSKEPNQLDNLQVNVNELYQKYPIRKKPDINLHQGDIKHFSFFRKIYRSLLLPLNLRNRLWYIFHMSNIDQFWFYEFNNYWKKYLKGRSMFVVFDFHFFKTLYRLKFQKIAIDDTNDPDIHLKTWQQNEVLYQLLHLVGRESSINKLATIRLASKYINFKSYLEFGCGTAPITNTFLSFYKKSKKVKIYISDIETLAFHFATQRFSENENVIPISLKTGNNLVFNENINTDLIFSVAVFEHLNKPLETITKFHKILNNNGVLIFDFIKSDGDGLDTVHAIRERKDVLEFIEKNFILLSGKIDYEESMVTTVVRKKEIF